MNKNLNIKKKLCVVECKVNNKQLLCQMVVDVMKEVKTIRVDMDLIKVSTANRFKGRSNGRGGGQNGSNGSNGGYNKHFSGNMNGQGGLNGNAGAQWPYSK